MTIRHTATFDITEKIYFKYLLTHGYCVETAYQQLKHCVTIRELYAYYHKIFGNRHRIDNYDDLYKIEMHTCKVCGKQFLKSQSCYTSNDYCSRTCSAKASCATSGRSEKIKASMQKYKRVIVDETRTCIICGNAFTIKSNMKRRTCSPSCRAIYGSLTYKRKIESGEIKNPKQKGGFRIGSSRSKHGWYKGYWCDSTYELAFVIWCIDHNVKIARSNKWYLYTYKGKQHRYYPDFIVNGELVEIKNYSSELTDAKLASVTDPIKCYYGNDLQYCFDYVTSTYNVTKEGIYHLYDNVSNSNKGNNRT